MSTREYSGNAKATKLNGAISNTDTALVLVDGTGYPTGAAGPFVITLDVGLAAEEKILCTARSGNNITAGTRGYDGTTAAAHDNQANVTHTISAVDLREANAHVNGTTDAHDATAISYAGSTNLSSTTVEAALDELDSEKLAVSAAAELIRDTIGTALVAGSNITLTVNDAGDTITIAASAAAAEEAWHTVGSGGGEPAFAGAWANSGSGYQTLQYKKVGNEVRIRGVVSGAVGAMFTLPAGYRPPAAINISMTNQFGALTYAEILTTGVVSVSSTSGYSFVGLSTQFWID